MIEHLVLFTRDFDDKRNISIIAEKVDEIISEVNNMVSQKPTANTTKDDNWRCGTTDCVCNKNGVCDCHNYTQPPTASVG